MIDELRELNEQFYVLCSRLDKYCEKLSDEQYAYMQAVLLEQYKDEYTLLALQCGIETKRKIDELQAKSARLVPQRWRGAFFRRKRNYAAVLNDAKADKYAARVFAEIEDKILAEAPNYVPGEAAEEQSVDGGEASAAPMSDEGGTGKLSEVMDIAELEAKLARDAWEKLNAKMKSADPKSTKSDGNVDVAEIPKNRDEGAQPAEARVRKSP